MSDFSDFLVDDRDGFSVKELWLDSVFGFPCFIVQATLPYIPSWMNGYVAIPREHWLLDKEYTENAIDVHGGVTFFEHMDSWVVIGFDTAHTFSGYISQDLDLMRQEVNELASQVRELMK